MFRWAVAACSLFAFPVCAFSGGWGTVKGQFIVDGDMSPRPPIIAKGDAGVAAFCAAQDVPDETLVIDPETKGIKNIFIYMKKAPAEIHPDLKASPVKEVVFDQKECRFIPHALILRTDQAVRCISNDGVAHNLHTNTLLNTAINQIIQPNDQQGITLTLPTAERYPAKVQCDIHAFMSAWWGIVDHPYATLTDEQGRFTIENLPEGEHEFVVWLENVGLIPLKMGYKRTDKFTFKVKAGETTELPAFKVPAKAFEAK